MQMGFIDPSKDYQFRTELSYEKGKEVIELNYPSLNRYKGTMHYSPASVYIYSNQIENFFRTDILG